MSKELTVTGSNITIVMQGQCITEGQVCSKIIKNMKTTRENLPDAELILSTWDKGSTLNDQVRMAIAPLNVIVIFNDDPGSVVKNEKGISYISNINRMIVSSATGIKAATNEIVVKIRSDSYLYSNVICSLIEFYFSAHNKLLRTEEFSVFSQRVINCNLYARNARGYLPYLFHPGDICVAGYKNDILSLFNVPLVTNDIFKLSRTLTHFSTMALFPEQYIWVNCIRKSQGKLVYKENLFRNEALVSLSERYYVNNFITHSAAELGFCWDKQNNKYHGKGKYSVYHHADWLDMYDKYILQKDIFFSVRLLKNNVIRTIMLFYFFFRTNLLRINIVRKLAIWLFVKRDL
ncbi:WavE lipopolysaccharide synthesis family protein [Yersinia enterocolitica]|uniref:WavE lipopolysaccharide synthesis family protein n=1 Tax=Yersinia enterocolitica TaxID=630 RepID=UPI000ADE00B8|nr:WavE lipopolysaccharide synthesis family protein [Yersinia enterocolitica]HDM8439128.1 WavE lipopolysaccharide synthesis [Yersinia enterocolitica]